MTWLTGEVEYYPRDEEAWDHARQNGGEGVLWFWVEAVTPGAKPGDLPVKPPYKPVIQLACAKCGDWCWGGKFTYSMLRLAAGRTLVWCRACFLRHLGPDDLILHRNPDDPDFNWDRHGNVPPSDPRFDWDYWDMPADLRRWDDWDPEEE